MNIDFRSLGSQVAGLAWVAFRSLAATVLVLTATGLVLAVVSGYVLRANALYALLSVVLALIEAVSIGVLLGSKRALVAALAHGIARLRLGSSVVRLCFERLLKVSTEEEHGSRGTQVAQAMERIPLAQAEKRLVEVIDVLMHALPEGGGLTGRARQWLHRRLLGLVRDYTLARFREEEARDGGVDLIRVQSDLEARIDDLLVARLRRGLNLWTLLALAGLVALVLVQTWAILALVPVAPA